MTIDNRGKVIPFGHWKDKGVSDSKCLAWYALTKTSRMPVFWRLVQRAKTLQEQKQKMEHIDTAV